jgi:hypothetical protein
MWKEICMHQEDGQNYVDACQEMKRGQLTSSCHPSSERMFSWALTAQLLRS